jgi:hypothetical protein
MSEHTLTSARPGAGNAGTEIAQDVQEVAAAATDAIIARNPSAHKRIPQLRWPGLPQGYYHSDPLSPAEASSAILMFHARRHGYDRLQTVRIRPNPEGGKRPWMASVNRSLEIELTERELRCVRRFASAFHRYQWCWLGRRIDGLGEIALDHLPSQAVWEKMIRNVVTNAAKFREAAE